MLSNNVPNTFLVEESDFLPVSGRSRSSSNGRPYYFIKGPVHVVNKVKLAEKMFINMIGKFPFNIKEFLSEFVYKPLQLLCDFFCCLFYLNEL